MTYNIIMFFKICFVLSFLAFTNHFSFAQNAIKELPSGYLMTVAAYLSSGEEYAIRYTTKLQKEGYSADYGFTFKKQMYFVYIHHYDSFRIAINQIDKTRNSTPFDDAWVYVYVAVNPVSEVAEVKKEDKPGVPGDSIGINVRNDSSITIQEKPVETVIKEDSIVTPVEESRPEGSRLVYIEAVRARTNEPIDIDFTVIDPSRQKIMGEQVSNIADWIEPPENATHDIQISPNTFGWKKYSLDFNFDNPITDSTSEFTSLQGNTLIVRFEMSRYKRGDIQTLYNVYFFNGTSIMRPQSKYELNQLLQMLEDNPNYTILIHGHSNGHASGKIIKLASNDTVYFNLHSKAHIESISSAKDLSVQRAMTIKSYLVTRGILSSRMKVKGWGGKKMLFDENSSFASKNARVEIEIITD